MERIKQVNHDHLIERGEEWQRRYSLQHEINEDNRKAMSERYDRERVQQTEEEQSRQAKRTLKDQAQAQLRTEVGSGVTMAAVLVWMLSMVLQPCSAKDVQEGVQLGVSQAAYISPWVLVMTKGIHFAKQPVHRSLMMANEAWRTRTRSTSTTSMARLPQFCLLMLIGFGYVSCISETMVAESQVSY